MLDITPTKRSDLELDGKFPEILVLRDQPNRAGVTPYEEIGQVTMFEEIVGGSLSLKAVLARATKVAPTDSTVLITAETGTGKSGAAVKLGLPASTLESKIRSLRIDKYVFKTN